MTAAELINEARDFHQSFTPEDHPNIVCLRALSRSQSDFFAKVSEVAEQAVAKEYVVEESDIEAATEGAPIFLPSFLRILSVLAVADECLTVVGLAHDERTAGFEALQARLVGTSLYLAQPDTLSEASGADLTAYQYDGVTALKVRYIPKPVDLEAMSDELVVPDEGREWLLGDIVRMLATRTVPTLPEIAMVGDELKKRVMDNYVARANETSWFVRPISI